MCGIIGFTGYLNAKDVVLNGLAELEYRGYDSAGIACLVDGKTVITKTVGKVAALKAKVPEELHSFCGMGHTRWATHGGVTEANAHPHQSGCATVVHNGIIENYHEIGRQFVKEGKTPISQTDTEIAAMVFDTCYEGNGTQAIIKAVSKLKGSYAFCIMFEQEPDTIYCIRKGNPLVAAHTQQGSIVASDVVALLRYSKEYFVVPENCVVKMMNDEIAIVDLQEKTKEPEVLQVSWDISEAQKNGYKHYMLKEIHEQPDALRRTISARVKDGMPDFTADHIPDSVFEGMDRIIITACGTAMHAGLIGKNLMERFLRIPVSVDIASEFRYQNPILDENTLVITISQSGETADTLESLRLAKQRGARTLSIVNVKGSSIARCSEYVLYTHAGPEIAVASTKAYTAQLACLYLLVFRVAYAQKKISGEECSAYLEELQQMIPRVEEVLQEEERIRGISKQLITSEDLFFIGRGMDYALSMEGSIKLKEITYIHSEAYAAGELKHGTLSLITEGIPVIALATQNDVYAKMASNVKEVKARGALVILITGASQTPDISLYDYHIAIPKMADLFAPFAAAVLLQQIAYYTSNYRGLDVDQPRNLAKSVTVE